MIRLTEIVKSTKELDNVLEKYRKLTNWTDWYMSGGCYTFADALYLFLGKSGKFVSVGEVGSDTMVHMCILYKGLYCDYNGCRTRNDVLGDVSLWGKPEWKLRTRKDVIGEHNYSSSEVSKIVKQLKELSK